MHYIEFKNIYKTFDKKEILKNFSLNIDKGDKILIYGESGIGKSTIFKLLLGFVLPDKGEIYYKGELLNENNIWELRKNISYIPQSVDIGEGNVKDFICHIMSYKINMEKRFEMEELYKLLDYFKLKNDILKKYIQNLSGGEKQRLAIIISILLKREIFLFDEITAQLDKDMKKRVIDYFINRKHTLISISHDSLWLENDIVKIIKLGKDE